MSKIQEHITEEHDTWERNQAAELEKTRALLSVT
jgi:hypothetical protein